ncbi:MAG: flagellar M-ring protein FliF [Deltaproteobacteria bacterium]|nr:flagellar M-ring protein FliF [Deltaproteobacteria bacterium]MBW2661345.1 flagellar M-ring protein FliF [Deltaproteobacteria bacterium]
MDSVFQFLSQSGKVFKSLSLSKRLSILVVAVITLISIVAFVFFVNQKEYRTLFSNLSTEDAGEIVAVLQEKKIPYKVSSAGDSILIPAEYVSELRLNLAASGLPGGGVVGFEIFDNKNFGVTDFVQNLNYQRALQGELSRTITGLNEIQHSRVHIVIPKKSLFVEKQIKPTASVIIKLKTGRKLLASQVEGIASLVAGSVEGLSSEEVMIVDSGGNILLATRSGSQSSKRTDSQMEFQRSVEKNLADRIQTMLEKVLGEGKVVARVSATLDFRVMEKTEESYDPEEPVVRSVHRRSEKSSVPVSEGESTVSSTRGLNTKSYGTDHEKTDEIVNYEINRVVSKTVMPVGKVEKLSMAVLIDGIYNKNDKGVEEFQPRSKKEIETLESLVKGSVGFDAKRGDQIVVTSIPFRKVELEAGFAEGEGWKTKLYLIVPFIKYFVSLIVFIFVLFFLLRPLIKFIMTKDVTEKISAGALPSAGVSQLQSKDISLDLGGETGESIRGLEVVKNMASQDARSFAELLRNWLR